MSTMETTFFSKNNRKALTKAVIAQLLKQKAVTKDTLQRLISVAETEGMSIDALLKRSGTVAEVDILQTIGKLTKAPYDARLARQSVDFQTIEELTADYIRQNNILPLLSPGNTQHIATAEPLDFATLDMLEFALDRPVQPMLAPSERIREVLTSCLPTTDAEPEFTKAAHADLRALANEAPVVSHLHDVLSQAIEKHASDIHFESTKQGLKTRFRIDGMLTEPALTKTVPADAIISRLKYLAKLNISERRKPQDGRIPFTFGGRDIDLRLSILPTQYGQSAVIRILDQNAVQLDWDALGFAHTDVDLIRKILSQSNGLFLVTGPTGSGKTTTLYTALNELNTPSRKIFTIEDPIEYNLAGVNQVQVNEAVGLTFAAALRSILRQDPNIILIGEIRDAETAEMACRAALVGRLVLSTLHTNSASQARTRLMDLGVAEYLIDAVLKGVLGQSLEIQPCKTCKGSGCEACGRTGAEGRRLEYELVASY